jgi:hypothetical protein
LGVADGFVIVGVHVSTSPLAVDVLDGVRFRRHSLSWAVFFRGSGWTAHMLQGCTPLRNVAPGGGASSDALHTNHRLRALEADDAPSLLTGLRVFDRPLITKCSYIGAFFNSAVGGLEHLRCRLFITCVILAFKHAFFFW